MGDYNKIEGIILQKIPHVLFIIQTLIANMVYGKCPNQESYKLGYYIYFPILLVLCGVWYGFKSYRQLKTDYPKKPSSIILFTALAVFESVGSLIVASVALLGGKPYSCYYSYDPMIATGVFLLWAAVIATIGYIQHQYMNKDKYPLVSLVHEPMDGQSWS
jgi:hypothetical protein